MISQCMSYLYHGYVLILSRYITREDGSALMDCLGDWRQAALAKPKHARALEEEEPLSSSDEREPETVRAVPKKTSSWVRWWRSSRTEPQTPAEPAVPDYQRGRETDIKNVHLSPPRPSIMPSSSAPISLDDDASTIVFPSMKSFQNTSVREIGQSRSRSTSVVDRKHFAKTLRLTSDQLVSCVPGGRLLKKTLLCSTSFSDRNNWT